MSLECYFSWVTEVGGGEGGGGKKGKGEGVLGLIWGGVNMKGCS